MTPTKAMAEVFSEAFKALPPVEQKIFFMKLLKNVRWREDIIDLAIAENRKRERTRPFHNVLAEIRANRIK